MNDEADMRPPSERNAAPMYLARARALERDRPDSGAERGWPFSQYEIPLGQTNLDTTGQRITARGERLIYRREGSNPAGRLNVQAGGMFKDFYPGSVLDIDFDGIVVTRSQRSSSEGYALLIVCSRADVDFREPLAPAGEDLAPVNLLGDVGAGTFATVAEDTQPSGATPTGSFVVTGWSKLRVTIDGQAANTLEDCILVPWIREPGSGVWLEQGSAAINVPNTHASGYRYRTINVDALGNGRMFFEVRSLNPAAQTQLGFAVQGVE